MEDCCVHHVEFVVSNGEEFQRNFTQQYKFYLSGTRKNDAVKQWVLKSGSANVLLTQQVSLNLSASGREDLYFVGGQFKHNNENTSKPFVDSVFNVALKVKDIKMCVDKMTRSNVTLLRPIQTVKDDNGEISFAVVKSCIGNVVHTLVQDDGYTGVFLPGFTDTNNRNTESELVSHIDHVTFACECGDSNNILDWYANCFGMRRFLINRDESDADGFVIDTEDIGVRLKAFEYWKCAETGLTTGSHPESIKFVVAEALPNQGPNQIDTFLSDHCGPGVQHVGLHTSDIIDTVSQLMQSGVAFVEPPYTYYTEVGKYQEICDIGQNVDILRKHGILVDAEADTGEITHDDTDVRYLMQKFTKPLFDKNTFFLEIIQRVGAQGFGSGNITALWRSVQAYINSKEKEQQSS